MYQTCCQWQRQRYLHHWFHNSQATNREKKDGSAIAQPWKPDNEKQPSKVLSQVPMLLRSSTACLRACMLDLALLKAAALPEKKGTSPTEQAVWTQLMHLASTACTAQLEITLRNATTVRNCGRSVAFLKVISNCAVHAVDAKCIKPHPADDHVLANWEIPAITPGRWHGLAFLCVVKESTHKCTSKSISNCTVSHWDLSLNSLQRKRKGSAGSDDTSSMIMGGGYLGARTRKPRKQ